MGMSEVDARLRKTTARHSTDLHHLRSLSLIRVLPTGMRVVVVIAMIILMVITLIELLMARARAYILFF